MLARLALGNVRKSLADFGIYFLTVMLLSLIHISMKARPSTYAMSLSFETAVLSHVP